MYNRGVVGTPRVAWRDGHTQCVSFFSFACAGESGAFVCTCAGTHKRFKKFFEKDYHVIICGKEPYTYIYIYGGVSVVK